MPTMRAGVFVLGILAPGLAQDEGVNLEAVAAELEAEGCPDVRALLPGGLEEWSREVTGDTPRSVLVATIRTADSSAQSALAAATRILSQDETARETAAGLLAEARACGFLHQRYKARLRTARMMGIESPAPHWGDEVGPAARRRFLALLARILRDHGDSPAAGTALLWAIVQLESLRADQALELATTKLGACEDPLELLGLAGDALRQQDLALAESTLERAERAISGADPIVRSCAPTPALRLRRRLQRVREVEGETPASEMEEKVRRLRLLQLSNKKAALSFSEELVGEGVEHALPYSILACEAYTGEGDRERARTLLGRAARLPGRGPTSLFLHYVLEVLPLMQEGLEDPEREGEFLNRLAESMSNLDGLLATDGSEMARIYRWLRTETPFGQETDGSLFGASARKAQALVRELPHSRDAYLLLIVNALCDQDHGASREALGQPIPSPLRSLPELARLRTEAWLQLELADDHDDPDQFEQLTTDLAAIQGDEREAAYLRGVRLWYRACQRGDDRDLAHAAREQFAAAQMGFGERGFARTACALAVVDAALGRRPDLMALPTFRMRDGKRIREDVTVTTHCLLLLAGKTDPAQLKTLAELWDPIDTESARTVLHSALAVAHLRNEDEALMSKAAEQALDALAEHQGKGRFPWPALGRGVRVAGAFYLSFGVMGIRPQLQTTCNLSLWVVPRLPHEADLRNMAEHR